MVIRTAEYEILDSGTIISFEDEPITFELAADFLVRMVFKEDTGVPDLKIDYVAVDKRQIDVILTNFNNPLGSGNGVPVKLGFLTHKSVYFNFRIHFLPGGKSRTVHYTWYLREPHVVTQD